MKKESDGLKSAYDLAMERLGTKGGDLAVLTEEQKRAIAEIGRKTKARIAELEITFQQRLAKARAGEDAEKAQKEAGQIEDELAAAKAKARAEEERERERIRAQA